MSQDVYSAGFSPTQTVELQKMFQKCGFKGAEWVDIPAWLNYTIQLTAGQFIAGEKQSVGSSAGADFYLRRIQLVNAAKQGTGERFRHAPGLHAHPCSKWSLSAIREIWPMRPLPVRERRSQPRGRFHPATWASSSRKFIARPARTSPSTF